MKTGTPQWFQNVNVCKKNRGQKRTAAEWFSLGLLIVLSLSMIAPLVYVISTSLKSDSEMLVFPPKLIPDELVWENYVNLFHKYPFAAWLKNSLIVSVLTVIGTVLSSSFVAFGFARYRAKGKNLLFMILLSTMMLPFPVLMIPQFILFTKFGWIDTFLPLIVPAFFGSAYNIFLLRQFFLSLSNDLFDAARIDGCSEFRLWWNIALPLSGPALATVAIFAFIWSWNDLIGQVMFLNSSENYTLSIGMASMVAATQRITPWNLLMVAALIGMLPVLILFVFAQRYFVQGIQTTGLK